MVKRKRAPYQTWFNQQNYEALGNGKFSFLIQKGYIELPPALEVFRPWLEHIQDCFSDGFRAKPPQRIARNQNAGGSRKKKARSAPFDDETLNGHVGYSTIIDPVSDLGGDLTDLIVRYRA